jgi:hypothetical protein
MANIDREDILILTTAAKCRSCHCECHCASDMHIPSDELDAGGPCVCEECKHEI